LHEFAHLQRNDGWRGLAQQVAQCLLAPHPAAWFVCHQLDLERECACDDWALEHSECGPRAVGESLLECAVRLTRISGPSPKLLAAAYGRSSSQLRKRVIHMIDSERSHQPRPRRAPLALVGMGAALGIVFAASAWPRSAVPPAPTSNIVNASTASLSRLFSEVRAGFRSADDSPLYQAVRSGDLEYLDRLLDEGEDVNERWPGDGSPLIVAARQGSYDLVARLIERGADADLGVGGDGTPLIQAASAGHREILELLLASGADLDHAGRGGDGNPLIAASLRGNLEIVELLVSRGASVNRHVPDDDTPLINAAQQGHAEVVEFLLESGADPNLTGDFDRRLNTVRTPLNQALANGHTEVTRLLRAAGGRE
jgi:hypothetical protein